MTDPIKPSKRDRFRPVELLVMSAIVAVFIALVVAASVRNIGLGAIFGGIGFIVALVVLATLAITTKPDSAEIDDLDEQDRSGHTPGSGH
jgi:high-affinity Fe2+/Pb2+ permease